MNTQKNLSLNMRYTGMQIPYWMGFSILTTFASVFLLSCGFTNGQIGIVLALANLLAVLLQPCIAALADRSVKLTLSGLTAALALVMVLFSGLLIFLPKIFLLTAALYIILITFLMVLQPMTISLGTFYISRGYSLNFGLSRGIGSLAFAAASALTGRLVDRYSPTVILYLLVLVFSLFFLAVLGLDTRKTGGKYSRSLEDTASPAQNADSSPEEPCSLPVFFKTYKKFMLLLVGISLLFTYHNIQNNYLFQIMQPLNGTAGDMGFSLSIAAVCELPTMFLFSWLLKHFKCKSLVKTAALFFTLKGAIFLLATDLWMINLAQGLQFLAFALHTAASVYYTSQIIPKKDLVKGQALMTTANTVGGVLGNLLGGQMLNYFGIFAMLLTGTLLSAAGTLIVFASAQDGEPLTPRKEVF